LCKGKIAKITTFFLTKKVNKFSGILFYIPTKKVENIERVQKIDFWVL